MIRTRRAALAKAGTGFPRDKRECVCAGIMLK